MLALIIVAKQYTSAFFETSVAATLYSLGVDTVLFTGQTVSISRQKYAEIFGEAKAVEVLG